MKKTVIGTMVAGMLCVGVLTIGSTSVAESAQPEEAAVDTVANVGHGTTPLAGCQNVTLTVKNNKSVKIKALKVEYKSIEDGKWRTESFSDTVITSGSTSTVKSGATLEHVEGHKMGAIKLHYKKWCGWQVVGDLHRYRLLVRVTEVRVRQNLPCRFQERRLLKTHRGHAPIDSGAPADARAPSVFVAATATRRDDDEAPSSTRFAISNLVKCSDRTAGTDIALGNGNKEQNMRNIIATIALTTAIAAPATAEAGNASRIWGAPHDAVSVALEVSTSSPIVFRAAALGGHLRRADRWHRRRRLHHHRGLAGRGRERCRRFLGGRAPRRSWAHPRRAGPR